jgi:hypothetical protein
MKNKNKKSCNKEVIKIKIKRKKRNARACPTTAKQRRYLPPTFESGSDRHAAVTDDTPATEVHFSGMDFQYRHIW